MKKILLGLGTIVAIAVPMVSVISCGFSSTSEWRNKMNTEGKFLSTKLAAIESQYPESRTALMDIAQTIMSDNYVAPSLPDDVLKMHTQITNLGNSLNNIDEEKRFKFTNNLFDFDISKNDFTRGVTFAQLKDEGYEF